MPWALSPLRPGHIGPSDRVEAGVVTGRHAATITEGRAGVLRAMSLLLQDGDGQVMEAHSISAGLDYPVWAGAQLSPGNWSC